MIRNSLWNALFGRRLSSTKPSNIVHPLSSGCTLLSAKRLRDAIELMPSKGRSLSKLGTHSEDRAACRYTIRIISATSAHVRTKCVLWRFLNPYTLRHSERFQMRGSSLASGIPFGGYVKAVSIREAPSKWVFNDKLSTVLGIRQHFLTRSSNRRSPSFLVLRSRNSWLVTFTIS